MAAKGYPGNLREGLGDRRSRPTPRAVDGVEIFHAGTKQDGGHIVANGGRVLNVSALGKTVSEAQARAYAAIDAHSLAGRLLPPRHRLARNRARKISKISRLALCLTKRYQEEKHGGEDA